jgi:hypothetical protein
VPTGLVKVQGVPDGGCSETPSCSAQIGQTSAVNSYRGYSAATQSRRHAQHRPHELKAPTCENERALHVDRGPRFTELKTHRKNSEHSDCCFVDLRSVFIARNDKDPCDRNWIFASTRGRYWTNGNYVEGEADERGKVLAFAG